MIANIKHYIAVEDQEAPAPAVATCWPASIQFDRCAFTTLCAKLDFAAVLPRFPEVRPADCPKDFTTQRERLNL